MSHIYSTHHHAVTRMCNLSTDSILNFTDSNLRITLFFIESTSCTPNPCKHNGKCKIINSGFECDCTGTFYKGKTCERGILKVPEIPILFVNQTKYNLELQGYPDANITVTLTASTSIILAPKKITLTKNKTSATFAVTGREYGFLRIKYNITGENAVEFDNPDSTVVFIDKAKKTIAVPICYLCGGILEKGCFTEKNKNLIFTSNLQWSGRKTTRGITQILAYGNKTLPLSLTGAQILTSDSIVLCSVRNELEAEKTNRFIRNCSIKGIEEVNIGSILRTHAFEYSIQVYFNTYSPSWFKLIAALNVNEYYAKDLVGDIYIGSVLQRKLDNCMTGFSFNSNSTYYIHKTNQIYNILLPNNFIELPSFITKCLIMDLNENHIYFGFSRNNYVTTSTNPIYETIVARFSGDVSSVIGFHVMSSKISFEMSGNSHQLNVVGRRSYNLSFTDLSSEMNIEGRFSFVYDQTSEAYKEMTFGKDGVLDFSLAFMIQSEEHSLQINTLNGATVQFKEIRSSGYRKLSGLVSSNMNISKTANLSKAFSFTSASPVTLNLTYNLLPLTFSSEHTKSNLLRKVKKAKETITDTLNFLKMLPVDRYLSDHLETLKNSMTTLLEALSSYPTNVYSAFSDIELIRLLFAEELKMFSVLLDQYVQIDIVDSVGMKIKFINLKNQFKEFIQNTNVNSRQQYAVGELSGLVVEGKGQLCVEHFCFTQLNLVVDLKQNNVIGNFIKQDDIGDYIELFPLSKIHYDLKSTVKSASMKGEVMVFKEVKEVDITINKSVLFFNTNAKIGNEYSIRLYVESSLDAVLRDDPLYFVFTGNMAESDHLKKDIENTLQDYFKNLEQTLYTRKMSLNTSKLLNGNLLNEAINATYQVLEKYQKLKKQLESVDSNLTMTKSTFLIKKAQYKQAVEQNSDISEYQIQRLVEQCQPKLCNTSCLPGLKNDICHKQRQVPLIDQPCILQNVSTTFYQYVKVNKIVPTTKYELEYNCWTECSFLRKLFGKRKRRNINPVIGLSGFEIFNELGGAVSGIGAGVGGLLFGPLGAFAGGIIASFFGPCDRYCAYDYIPVSGYVRLVNYEKQPITKKIPKAKCESNIRYVNGSTSSVYECAVKSRCIKVYMDDSCVAKQLECNDFRKNITNSILHKSVIEKKFQEFSKIAFIYHLLITKRNMLSQQLQTLEQEVGIALALNNSAFKSHFFVEKSLKSFEDAVKNDKSLIEKYKKQPNLFRSNVLKLNFSYTSGMKFPESFLIDIDVFGLTSAVLFDVSNYQKSVTDISIEIKNLVKETMFGKRKQRSVLNNMQPNQMDKKCHLIRQAEMFLLEVLKTYHEKHSKFTKLKSFKAEQLKTNKEQLENIKRNISNQFAGVVDYSTKILLNKELDEIFGADGNTENDNSLTDSWNSTLIDTFSEMQLLVNDMQQTNCVNFLDCLEFYTDALKSTTRFEERIGSLNVTEATQTWKTNILQLTTSYPDVNQSGKLVAATVNSLLEVGPTQWFCGNGPSVKVLLTGTINIKEGDSVILKVEVLNEKFDYKIIWKHNNYILKGYNTTVFNKSLTKKDEGYYSCEISNKFGVGNCGRIFVKIFEKIQFLSEPQDVVGYLYSPRKIYLTCAMKSNTLNGTYSWFFRKFYAPPTENDLLSESKPYFEVNQDTDRSTGFYFCKYNNKVSSALSREAVVHILKTTVALERIGITMVLSQYNSSRTRRQIQDEDTIKFELAKLMQTNPKQIEIKDLINRNDTNDQLALALSGINLTLSRENYNWNSLTEKVIKERENLLLRSALLYFHANNSRDIKVNGKTYLIDAYSITVEHLEPLCPEGQTLRKDGFICGKFNKFILHQDQYTHHIETNHLIFSANQLTCFCILGRLSLDGLRYESRHLLSYF